MTAFCAFCGRPAVHAHHVTGREERGGAYLDGDIVADLCLSHHVVSHVGERRLAREYPAPDDDRIAHRLLRVASHCERLLDADRPLVLRGAVLAGVMALLVAAAHALRRAKAQREEEQ
jgi:hypothetical protein